MASIPDTISTPPLVDSDSLPVPAYTATDDGDLTSRIENAPAVQVPILHSPVAREADMRRLVAGQDFTSYQEAYRLECDIVDSFFAAIDNGHDDVVAHFIAHGWVSPDTTSRFGETPLLAAVRVGKTPMVSQLVALGATVNAFSRFCQDKIHHSKRETLPERTPLMVAAERGHLALVKVLMQDYGADDSLVAPDGAMALRLAAVNGHREIVHFLPSRRGGAWLRWKTAHQKEMERVRRAWRRLAYFVRILAWEIPKFVAYEMPKGTGRFVWKRRHRMAAACKRMAREVPRKIKKEVLELPGNIVRGGKAVWRGIKEIPPFLKSVAVAMWKSILKIPGALMMVLRWIGRGLKSMGEAFSNIFLRLFSLLHTVVMAAVTFFRGITLKDIWDGFCSLVRAIFVDAPKAIGKFIVSLGETIYDALKSLFGLLGECVWHIGAGLLWLIEYIPRRIWTMIEAMGNSLVRAYQETMAYLNPRRM
ncbi:hypothetical protein FZEAL_1671 [Fusarium zealandicum]|uniref:Ankyrin n=1 Tax=Fusarium zealandicum TaxID=1053134 RepID=A0A8H4USA3_9HYPO|nr:hypothetical protein FZEAL_1671 [Fusarium zealandicum]